MLRNNNGFFLLELLLSLSAMFMIGLFLIPLIIDMNQQSKKLEIENKAQQILYEELQGKLRGAQTFTNYSLQENGVKYDITWRDSGARGQKEACISVKQNALLSKTEICGKLE
ncbi:competence type IV pilus minor pilin ComGE [Neobacillus fumarioli]|uniref:competence type IV pilus minor pilin ComGE n=1 Tax=Neobacillus fumarioli TaxID=105229 RepID=UPI00082BB662|nr:competence type IV pilus minor pilin ComGE [Neobacillus fumarioli]